MQSLDHITLQDGEGPTLMPVNAQQAMPVHAGVNIPAMQVVSQDLPYSGRYGDWPSRGWYVCDEDGRYYLDKTGTVANGIRDRDCFWPTEQEARQAMLASNGAPHGTTVMFYDGDFQVSCTANVWLGDRAVSGWFKELPNAINSLWADMGKARQEAAGQKGGE